MTHYVHFSECPVCKSSYIDPLLTAKDFTVSGESFVIWQCRDCTLRFTQDVPDAEHIGKYYQSEDYISHSNSNKGIVNQLYQRVRKLTLMQKTKLIKEECGIDSGSILDVGSGTGAFLNTMQQHNWSITGVEPDPKARSLAESLYKIELLEADQLFHLPEHSYDAITLWHVLEHVHDLHNYVAKLKSLLKPGGKLFIAVPNYLALEASIYGPFWAAYDVPRHLYHFTPKAIEALIKQHGLKMITMKPMWFDSFYISMLSSKYHSGKTKLAASFINGLRSNAKAAFNKDRCSSLIYIVAKDQKGKFTS